MLREPGRSKQAYGSTRCACHCAWLLMPPDPAGLLRLQGTLGVIANHILSRCVAPTYQRCPLGLPAVGMAFLH